MSSISDIIEGVRKAILIEHRVNELAASVKDIDARERDTRDRVARLEGMIAGAQISAKRLR